MNAKPMILIKVIMSTSGTRPRAQDLLNRAIFIPLPPEPSNMLDESLEEFRSIHWKVGNSGIATKGR